MAENSTETKTAPEPASKEERASEAPPIMDPPALNLMMQKWLGGLYVNKPTGTVVPAMEVPEGAQSLEIILARLSGQMQLSISPKSSLCAGGTHLTVLAQGLATYLTVGLHPKDLERIALHIYEETNKWLLFLFQLPPSSFTAIYHSHQHESLVKVLRIALNMRYGKHLTEGAENVFYSRPPTIYVSMSGNVVACQNACMQLNLPLSVITTVPCNTVFGSTHAMDITALEKCINDDTAKGKTPLLVIACAGTSIAGHIDNLKRIRELTTEYNLWLHVEGHSVSLACLKNQPLELESLQEADSILLQPGVWFGLMGAPYVTLFRKAYTYKSQQSKPPVEKPKEADTPTEADPEASSEETTEKTSTSSGGGSHHSVTKQLPMAVWMSLSPYGSCQLQPLVLWVNIQYLGIQTLVDTIIYSNNLAKMMIAQLDKIPGIRRVEVPNHWCHVVLFKYVGGGELTRPASTALISSPDTTATPSQEEENAEQQQQQQQDTTDTGPDAVTETVEDKPSSTTMTATAETAATAAEGEEDNVSSEVPKMAHRPPEKEIIPELPDATANAFTQLIATDLFKSFPRLGLTTVNIPRAGNCIRFDPVTSFPDIGSSRKDVESFCDVLGQKMRDIHATALARHVFQTVIMECKNLRYLDFPASLAVGFVQYLPLDWASKKELTVDEVRKLNQHNVDLVKGLHQHTNLYTSYQHGNFTCIALKSLTETDNIFHLVEILKSETVRYEESNKYIEGMSDMIVKGIQTAQQDLAAEKERALQEESLLKNIPVVGSLWGWFVASPTSNTKGRAFDLQSGKMESTESLYKYHMQVVEGKEKESTSDQDSQHQQEEQSDSGQDESETTSNEEEQ